MAGDESFELGTFESPLERFLRALGRQGDEGIVAALQGAIELGGKWSDPASEITLGGNDLYQNAQWRARWAETRERFRRHMHLSPQQIETLDQLASEAGEESFASWYILLEVVYPAAVASASGESRIGVAANLGYAAAKSGQFERARQATADAVETMAILDRLSLGDAGWLSKARGALGRQWAKTKEQGGVSREPFDVADDPSSEWLDLILWNTDYTSAAGLLAQSDATLRLAVRFEDWTDRLGRSLDALIPRLLAHALLVEDPDGHSGSFFTARLAVTIADALIELQLWASAVAVYRRIAEMPDADLAHPLWLHAQLQHAYCAAMQGDARRCRALLEVVDLAKLRSMAKLVITVGAELARYYVIAAVGRSLGASAGMSHTRAQIDDLLAQVRIIASPDPKDRTEWLRTLFVAILNRDVQYMLSGVP